jgi:DNA repair protein RadC
VLRNGSPGLSALGAAQRLLAAAGGLGGLLSADRASLRGCGAGDGRAAVVLAAAELARRMSRSRIAGSGEMGSADAVAAYLQLRSGLDEQEVMAALYLNVHNRLLADREIFRGTLTQATVEPRPILSLALRHRAARFILWHSHPGGDPEPTLEDLAFTRRMLEVVPQPARRCGGIPDAEARSALKRAAAKPVSRLKAEAESLPGDERAALECVAANLFDEGVPRRHVAAGTVPRSGCLLDAVLLGSLRYR